MSRTTKILSSIVMLVGTVYFEVVDCKFRLGLELQMGGEMCGQWGWDAQKRTAFSVALEFADSRPAMELWHAEFAREISES